jgi:CBS domain containing-hemolysin-like protein
VGTHRWHVTGITNLRRLGRYFNVQLPPSKSTTIMGILQEQLQRMPAAGDQVRWSHFDLRVLEIKEQGGKEQRSMTVELKWNQADEHAARQEGSLP